MGFFDLFKGKKDGTAPRNSADKYAERANDKRAQTYDRAEALAALADLGTPEAATALLKRFTFQVDPSISDQEEKNLAFRGLLQAGREALEPMRTFAKKAESVAWPLRVAKELLDPEEYVGEVLLWLERWTTDYAKFSDPKMQLLAALSEQKDPRTVKAVIPFLDDTLEAARFQAVATLFSQEDDSVARALADRLSEEESVRIRTKIADGFVASAWPLPEEVWETTRKSLPRGFVIDGEGRVRKSAPLMSFQM